MPKQLEISLCDYVSPLFILIVPAFERMRVADSYGIEFDKDA